jgi:hypothetical protein
MSKRAKGKQLPMICEMPAGAPCAQIDGFPEWGVGNRVISSREYALAYNACISRSAKSSPDSDRNYNWHLGGSSMRLCTVDRLIRVCRGIIVRRRCRSRFAGLPRIRDEGEGAESIELQLEQPIRIIKRLPESVSGWPRLSFWGIFRAGFASPPHGR